MQGMLERGTRPGRGTSADNQLYPASRSGMFVPRGNQFDSISDSGGSPSSLFSKPVMNRNPAIKRAQLPWSGVSKMQVNPTPPLSNPKII